jgi:hypothetical protein
LGDRRREVRLRVDDLGRDTDRNVSLELDLDVRLDALAGLDQGSDLEVAECTTLGRDLPFSEPEQLAVEAEQANPVAAGVRWDLRVVMAEEAHPQTLSQREPDRPHAPEWSARRWHHERLPTERVAGGRERQR